MGMIKVLVADDEVRVCNLICNIVDWSAFGMQIVATAHDGLQAYACVEREQPDLVVTDIRMPGLDGLTLIGKIRDFCPNAEIVIISGYRDFEYAQEAIKYGANAYLLKPVNKEELEGTLEKIRWRYLLRTQEVARERTLLSRIDQDSDQLRAMFFGDWLLNPTRQASLSYKEANGRYHYQFGPGLFRAYVVKLDFPCEKEYTEAACTVLRDKLAELLHRYLHPLCMEQACFYQRTRILGFANYEAKQEGGLRRQVLAFSNEMNAQKDVFRQTEITLGLGTVKKSLDALPCSLEDALQAVNQRLVDTAGLHVLEGYSTGAPDRDVLQGDFKMQLSSIVERLDEDAVLPLLHEFRERVMTTPALSGTALLQAAEGAFSLFLAMMRTLYGPADAIETAYGDFEEQLELVHDAAGVFALLSGKIAGHLAMQRSALREAVTRPIGNARRYILEHYREPVTLEEIAGVAGFNPSYFSVLFKKECGETFLEYLSGVRIAKAKELLRGTDLSVADICTRVGYVDLKHFNRTFKKLASVTPTEFRKLYS
ncbi:MAG: response regulator [Candidatus Pelethousia sp.]|nr:response regulator [Candidatus Pelethousia sp.]